VELGIGIQLTQLRDAVVAGERVGVAEVERIAVRHLDTPVEIATECAADDALHVLEPVE
jgi:hypothetical protein